MLQDVYKRQAFGKGFFRPFHKLVQNILVVLAQEAIGFYKSPFNRSFVNALAPVSYTHLDVYKRQSLK